jgi:type VI secretion system protein ImpA
VAAVAPVVETVAGPVRNREQVLEVLERVCDYYATYEPSSPLPLLLKRCQRLCTLSFRELVEDLTPAALKELDVIAGKPPAKK